MSVDSINLVSEISSEKIPNQKEALRKFDIDWALAWLWEASKDTIQNYEFLKFIEFSQEWEYWEENREKLVNIFNVAFNLNQEQFESLA